MMRVLGNVLDVLELRHRTTFLSMWQDYHPWNLAALSIEIAQGCDFLAFSEIK